MADWTAFPVGIVISAVATMIGIAGGVLWGPYLILVMGLSPSAAVLSSLLIQIAGMGSGGVAAMMRKTADIRIALLMAVVAAPGVAVGVWLQGMIAPQVLVLLIGGACLTTALGFVYVREAFDFTPSTHISATEVARHLWVVPLLSVMTGLLSVGAGDFLVPILRARVGMKMDVAIGTCLLLMAINASVASGLLLLAAQEFSTGVVAWGCAGVLIGGQIGPRIATKVPDQTLKEIFIYALSLVGIHVLFKA